MWYRLLIILNVAIVCGCTRGGSSSKPTDESPRSSNPAGAYRITAKPGQTLYAQANDISVYKTPDLSSPILLSINKGHQLVEISRIENWVEVGVTRTGKVGWVMNYLADVVQRGGKTTTPRTASFAKFESAFSELNRRVRDQTGLTFFMSAEDMGDGILHVTATDVWLSGSLEDKQSNLNTIYKLWKAADRTGLPIVVYIVDSEGNIVMSQ